MPAGVEGRGLSRGWSMSMRTGRGVRLAPIALSWGHPPPCHPGLRPPSSAVSNGNYGAAEGQSQGLPTRPLDSASWGAGTLRVGPNEPPAGRGTMEPRPASGHKRSGKGTHGRGSALCRGSEARAGLRRPGTRCGSPVETAELGRGRGDEVGLGKAWAGWTKSQVHGAMTPHH